MIRTGSRNRWCVLHLVFIAASPVSAAEPKHAQILFVGSSSSYWNDLPEAVAGAVGKEYRGRPGVILVPAIVGRSGSDIRVYAEPGFNDYQYGVKPGQTFFQKLESEKPDLVVLQVVCNFIQQVPTDGGDSPHAVAVTRYCQAVRKSGGEPVFYEMGWGRGDREAEGRKQIFELAVKNQIRFFAPCSSAWARVYREKSELALQHPKDAAHPGDAGHFLNLACFYAALTRSSPVGKLPRTYPVWPHALGKASTPAEKNTEAERILQFRPTPYQATMPKWMHRNMAARATATLDDTTARYLETVAWEVWQDADKQLSSARSSK